MLGHPIYSPWRGVQNIESAKPFIAALRRGRFVLQVCADCGKTAAPARLRCEHCRGARLVWRHAEGNGSVLAITHYRLQYDHEYERKVPYNVALIQLVAGALIVGTVDRNIDEKVSAC